MHLFIESAGIIDICSCVAPVVIIDPCIDTIGRCVHIMT